jgi:hypothetical protein
MAPQIRSRANLRSRLIEINGHGRLIGFAMKARLLFGTEGLVVSLYRKYVIGILGIFGPLLRIRRIGTQIGHCTSWSFDYCLFFVRLLLFRRRIYSSTFLVRGTFRETTVIGFGFRFGRFPGLFIILTKKRFVFGRHFSRSFLGTVGKGAGRLLLFIMGTMGSEFTLVVIFLEGIPIQATKGGKGTTVDRASLFEFFMASFSIHTM